MNNISHFRKGSKKATKIKKIVFFSELKYETRFLKLGINHTRNEKAKKRFNEGILRYLKDMMTSARIYFC